LPLAVSVGIELVFLKDGVVEVQQSQGSLRGGLIEAERIVWVELEAKLLGVEGRRQESSGAMRRDLPKTQATLFSRETSQGPVLIRERATQAGFQAIPHSVVELSKRGGVVGMRDDAGRVDKFPKGSAMAEEEESHVWAWQFTKGLEEGTSFTDPFGGMRSAVGSIPDRRTQEVKVAVCLDFQGRGEQIRRKGGVVFGARDKEAFVPTQRDFETDFSGGALQFGESRRDGLRAPSQNAVVEVGEN